MATTQQRTPEEIAELKTAWVSDPCWDIEDTQGFEAYHAELLEFAIERQEQWDRAALSRREAKATELGVPGNLALADYVLGLERQLARMQEQLDLVAGR